MHIISRKKINDFANKQYWYKIVKKEKFKSFDHLRHFFPKADKVDKLTVFDIGGNKFRLIAAIHYNRQKMYIRSILTHREYNEGKWKE
jgi:mRNA interferase HigB